MSCGQPLLPERVAQVVDERKKAEKRVSDLERELATHIARDLLESHVSDPAIMNGTVIGHSHRTDDGGNPLGFLSAIASALDSRAEQHTPPLPYLFVLSSSPSVQTQTSLSTVLIVGSDEKFVKVLGESLKTKLGIKGGGKGSRWSGKFVGVWKASKEALAIAGLLKEM